MPADNGQSKACSAGWYLLEYTAPLSPPRLWLHGKDIDASGKARKLRIAIPTPADGGNHVVALLTRDTTDLRLGEGIDPDGLPFTLAPIRRNEAVRRMFDGLRREDGRRNWPRSAATLTRMLARLLFGDVAGCGTVLVAAYVSLEQHAQPCTLRTGLLPRAVEFDPLEQLKMLAFRGDKRKWETTGSDPKFRLALSGTPIPLPAGWYLFEGRMTRLEGQIVAPCLYPDYGEDTDHSAMIELPQPDADGRFSALILLKYAARELRFDPTVRQARLAISGLQLRRVGRLHALARMLPVHDDDGRLDRGSTVDALHDFIVQARREGVSKAAVALFLRYQRQHKYEARSYGSWLRRYDSITSAELTMYQRRAARMQAPTFSILLPVYETPERWLRRCLDSVMQQAWPHWELCVVDDASPSAHVRRVLEEYAARDPRIRTEFRADNGHISAASNTALAMASGQYVGLLDHDDELRPHALLEMAEAIHADPLIGLAYSDEDKIDEHGRRFEPYFKPDWNPDLLLGQNYLCHFSVIRTGLARSVGGFREGLEGSQDHDLVLRCTRAPDVGHVHHVPKVLYHWRAIPGSTALHRDAKDYAAIAGANAVAEHVKHEDPKASVEVLEHGHYRVHWPVPEPAPRVSLIVPTRDRPELLRTCVESLLSRTTYPHLELLVVDNRSTDVDALAYLDELRGRQCVSVLQYDAPFNYSAINNWAAAQATGSVLGLINNDIEVITPEWLQEMVGLALRPGVGAVGAMLLYPDGTIQHAGVVLGLGGIANHAYVGEPADIPGHGGRARVVQAISAVTGACLVVRRDLYERVGGLDERLQVAFNDIDFCLRLGQAGCRNLWTPFARLYHHESASRGRDESDDKRARFLGEVALMEARWGDILESDPAYNPNLSLIGKGFEFADPPQC